MTSCRSARRAEAAGAAATLVSFTAAAATAGTERKQQLVFSHHLTHARSHLQHLRVGLGTQLVFHLHGFEHQQKLARTHRLAGRHGELHHGGSHRGLDRVLGHANLSVVRGERHFNGAHTPALTQP